MKHREAAFVALLILQTTFVSAQVFPVQGNAALIPPYSVHLADYTTRSTDRFILNVVLANDTRPELGVRLRLRIEGQNIKIETKPEYIGSQIRLQGGIPQRLTGLDIAEYFNPNNLNFSGITRREFDKTGALPAGFYQFCIEVLEYNRGVKISSTICAPGWLILNDPPLVNTPRNNERLRPTLPQNVIIQWTPRHTGSPNSAFSTEYELTMVEVWPDNRNANDAILTSPPILERTTRGTSFIYGPAEIPLEPGRRYAFRIQAKSIVGVEEYDLFKNNGYSEVFSFVYGDVCEMPLNIAAEGIGPAGFRATWDARNNHTGFQVRFREANNSKAEWFTTSSLQNVADIGSLKSNTTYEYQVAGSCGPYESPFTQVATIKTSEPPLAQYSCGLPVENFNLDPASLTAWLNSGDIIQAGDFQVQLTRVTGSNGTFSGEGTVVVPFLNNVKVKAKFTEILVNKENRMVKGYMNVTGAALDIIPDEVTALMDELDEKLDKIEDGLNKAEDIVDDIDAVLDQVQDVLEKITAYLPDEIIQEINDAKAQIAEAKTNMNEAPTPEAKEAAKVEVKKAKEKLKEAGGRALAYYAQAVKKFINIVVTSLKELGQEASSNKATAKRDYEQSSDDLGQYVNAANGALTDGAPPTAAASLIYLDDHSYKLTDAEMQDKLRTDPDFKDYHDKTLNYIESIRQYQLLQLMEVLATKIESQEDVNEFAGLLKNEGVDILEQIGLQLKEGKSERTIIDYVKNEIKNSLSRVIDVIAAKQ